MAERDDEVHLETEEARGGSTPHVTRYVLGGSLALLILIYLILLLR